ncbi:hypothetical protein [Actinomycetospora flava]|uniref:Uncharacterized protein n=1 Tax=Actinomycetospora flava TaxID=3129232 RepID=A0ABU8M875_9PSEU
MYTLDTRGPVQDQIRALPPDAVPEFDRLREALESAPWDGDPYLADKPDSPMRTRPFGTSGLATYLILEDQRRVDLLLVQWA